MYCLFVCYYNFVQVMGVLLFHPTRGGAPEAPSTEAPLLLLVQHNNTTLPAVDTTPPAVDTTPPAVDTTPPAVKRSQVGEWWGAQQRVRSLASNHQGKKMLDSYSPLPPAEDSPPSHRRTNNNPSQRLIRPFFRRRIRPPPIGELTPPGG